MTGKRSPAAKSHRRKTHQMNHRIKKDPKWAGVLDRYEQLILNAKIRGDDEERSRLSLTKLKLRLYLNETIRQENMRTDAEEFRKRKNEQREVEQIGPDLTLYAFEHDIVDLGTPAPWGRVGYYTS